ncbi:MAG: hypothetical protein J7L58_02560 [Thermoplasmata archaeon]|nr:hypothetical protein [Thermoplasmata archaeon]
MGCYICGDRSVATCHHCYEAICRQHAHFIEEISAYLCDNCYEAHRNGGANILSE